MTRPAAMPAGTLDRLLAEPQRVPVGVWPGRRGLRAKEITVGPLTVETDLPTPEALRLLPRGSRQAATVEEFGCRVVARREESGGTSRGKGRGKRG